MPEKSGAQNSLFYRRIGTIYPTPSIGADLALYCEAVEGGSYYCKFDKDGRQIRATEWLCTHLAAHLGIATAECAILEDETGASYFGSRELISTASEFEVRDFLNHPSPNELGGPSEWPGRYLEQVFAFDMFVGNGDRSMRNFLLVNEGQSRRICAIDFASARLVDWSGYNFPVVTDQTVSVGRRLRETHGPFPASAFEMIDRIGAVPVETIEGILKGMPKDWLTAEQREGTCDNWSSDRVKGRLMALRSGIADGTLL